MPSKNTPGPANEQYQKTFVEGLAKVRQLHAALKQESDRGCALLAVSFIEYELGEALRNHLVDRPSVLKSLFDFNGALGTFSSKIDMAYALGLVGFTTRNNLHLVRRIRNNFGHHPFSLSFATPEILSLANQLAFSKYERRIIGRDRFVLICIEISGMIASINLTNPRLKEYTEPDPTSFTGGKSLDEIEAAQDIALAQMREMLAEKGDSVTPQEYAEITDQAASAMMRLLVEQSE